MDGLAAMGKEQLLPGVPSLQFLRKDSA